jgi:DNA polymerase III subunit epsilon
MTVELHTLLLADSETSGLPEDPNAKLIEIGAVWWSIDLGVTLANWSELVQGTSNEAEAVNKIPTSALAYGLPREHALEGIQSRAARADAIVCHRVEFDSFFLGDLGRPYICSKFQIEWPGVEPGASLLYTAAGLGVPIVTQHRALTDCLLLAECFTRVWQMSGAEGVRQMLRLAQRPRSRCVAQLPYERKDEAKNLKFRWNSTMKSWWKDVVDEDIAKLPFQVRRVPAGSVEYVGLAKQ